MIATFYYVKRKTGEWQTELAVRQGDSPQRGEAIEVNLHGEGQNASYANNDNVSKSKGPLTIEIHAEEM